MTDIAEKQLGQPPLKAEWLETAKRLEIDDAYMVNMERVLSDLEAYHYPTYEHSLRVALLGVKIAEADGLPPKPLFYAGTMHDRGKLKVPLETLNKTDSWTEADAEALKPHPMVGYYELMEEGMPVVAGAVALHHTFQPKGYPEIPPGMAPELPEHLADKIQLWGRRLALADYYDASHRKNSSGNLTGEQIKERVYQHNPDLTELIDKLYAEGIFSEE